jgi:hypothetical protein
LVEAGAPLTALNGRLDPAALKSLTGFAAVASAADPESRNRSVSHSRRAKA